MGKYVKKKITKQQSGIHLRAFHLLIIIIFSLSQPLQRPNTQTKKTKKAIDARFQMCHTFIFHLQFFFFFWCVHLCYAHIQIRTHQQKARSKQSNLELSKLLQGLSQLSLKSHDIYVKQKGKLFSARQLQQDISVTGH